MPKRDFTVTPMPAAPNSSGCVDNRGPGVMSSPGLPALRIPRNKLSTHSAHGAGGAGPPRRIPRNRCASDAPKRVPRKAAGPLQQRSGRSPRATTLRGIGARARSASGQIVSVGVSLYAGSPVHLLHRVASSLIDWVCSFDLIGECRPSSKVIDMSAQLFN